MNIAIVDSGVANLASVESAFRSLDVPFSRASRPAELEAATHIVLPGVGSFSSGMERLRESEMAGSLVRSVNAGKPLLAICLGLQLLCEGSEENPGVNGLGLISGSCARLPDTVRVPQLGWNQIEPPDAHSWIRPGMAAFANSYALFEPPEGWACATTWYGRRFISALEKDAVLACQFHPELSSGYGLDLIKRWITNTGSSVQSNRSGRKRVLLDKRNETSEQNGKMGTVRIIPCLDVRDGRVVKGIQFQNIRDAGDPAELAERYELQGADEIVILDIAAAPRGEETRVETVRRVRNRIHIPLTVGGGVRSVENARNLLSAGADKISVNSAAVQQPELIRRLADAFGTQCIVCAIDARHKTNHWEVLVNGGRQQTELDAVSWARQAESLGAGEILLTSWDRDGTRSGADSPLLEAVSSAVDIPVVASGGIGTPDDAVTAVRSGASAVLAASIFHDADLEVSDLKNRLREAGVEVRS